MSVESNHLSHPIQIANALLEFRPFHLQDPVPTGREIIAAAGHTDPEQFIVLQQLPAGDLEELRLNEHTDLRLPGTERFIVVRSDRTFRFMLESERQEWPVGLINSRTLRRLGGKADEEVAVFLERTEEADLELAEDEFVDLAELGVERFYFKPHAQLAHIKVNTKPVEIARGQRTGLEIKQAAINQQVNIQLDFVLTLHKANGKTQIIGNHDPVPVRSGQRYTAVADDDVS